MINPHCPHSHFIGFRLISHWKYTPRSGSYLVGQGFDTTDDDEALIIATSDEHGLAVRDVERWTHLKHLAAHS